MSDKLTYTKAFEELEQIVIDIENEQIDVDELSEKVKRAAQLLKLCSAKLKSTEEEVDKILEDLNNDFNN